jgi:phage portal protein BeeE
MSLNASNNRQEASSVMLQNKGASGVLSSGGNFPLTAEEAESVQSALDRKLGSAKNFNRVISTNADVKFQQIGMSAADLKIIEQGELTLRELCNLYSLDSSLFNDPANKTFNNRKEATKAMYSDAVIPTTQRLIDGLNNWLVPAWSLRDRKNYKIVLDLDHIEALQADQKLEAEKDKIVIEGINIILNLPISDEGKKKLLMDKYDFSEEQADIVVNTEI